jgi:hypothetical protein
LGNGWPGAPETADLIEWARHQPSAALRLVGLYFVQRAGTPGTDGGVFRPEEREWLLGSLRREGALSGPWPVAEVLTVAAAGEAATADFVLTTLKTNGRDGGDRGLAWILACHAFADDDRIKQWVATQLTAPAARSLILYNTNMIPQQWRDDPPFAQSLHVFVDAASGTHGLPRCGHRQRVAICRHPRLTVAGLGRFTALCGRALAG